LRCKEEREQSLAVSRDARREECDPSQYLEMLAGEKMILPVSGDARSEECDPSQYLEMLGGKGIIPRNIWRYWEGRGRPLAVSKNARGGEGDPS
jgi:hypothetical protein